MYVRRRWRRLAAAVTERFCMPNAQAVKPGFTHSCRVERVIKIVVHRSTHFIGTSVRPPIFASQFPRTIKLKRVRGWIEEGSTSNVQQPRVAFFEPLITTPQSKSIQHTTPTGLNRLAMSAANTPSPAATAADFPRPPPLPKQHQQRGCGASSSGDGTAPVPLQAAFQIIHSDASTTSTALRDGMCVGRSLSLLYVSAPNERAS